jgi:hypothetical protein
MLTENECYMQYFFFKYIQYSESSYCIPEKELISEFHFVQPAILNANCQVSLRKKNKNVLKHIIPL